MHGPCQIRILLILLASCSRLMAKAHKTTTCVSWPNWLLSIRTAGYHRHRQSPGSGHRHHRLSPGRCRPRQNQEPRRPSPHRPMANGSTTTLSFIVNPLLNAPVLPPNPEPNPSTANPAIVPGSGPRRPAPHRARMSQAHGAKPPRLSLKSGLSPMQNARHLQNGRWLSDRPTGP